MNKPIDDSALKRPMEKLMAKQGVGWIKLSQNKPENHQWCLVWGHYLDNQDAHFREVVAWWGDEKRGFILHQDKVPTHWMPFPNPPNDIEL